MVKSELVENREWKFPCLSRSKDNEVVVLFEKENYCYGTVVESKTTHYEIGYRDKWSLEGFNYPEKGLKVILENE